MLSRLREDLRLQAQHRAGRAWAGMDEVRAARSLSRRVAQLWRSPRAERKQAREGREGKAKKHTQGRPWLSLGPPPAAQSRLPPQPACKGGSLCTRNEQDQVFHLCQTGNSGCNLIAPLKPQPAISFPHPVTNAITLHHRSPSHARPGRTLGPVSPTHPQIGRVSPGSAQFTRPK